MINRKAPEIQELFFVLRATINKTTKFFNSFCNFFNLFTYIYYTI